MLRCSIKSSKANPEANTAGLRCESLPCHQRRSLCSV
jgi:hypothetical protein